MSGEVKVCRGACGETKPLTEFSYERGRGRYRPRCKECLRQENKDYRAKLRAEGRVRVSSGARKRPRANRDPIFTKCGPVMVTGPDGAQETRPPYTLWELDRILSKGGQRAGDIVFGRRLVA